MKSTSTHLVVPFKVVLRILYGLATVAVFLATVALISVAPELPGVFWVIAALMVASATAAVVYSRLKMR